MEVVFWLWNNDGFRYSWQDISSCAIVDRACGALS
jgi:hypothetical protein